MPFSTKDLSNDLFFQIFRSPMIGLLFTSFDGKIIEANDTFLKFVGYTRKDFDSGMIDWIKLTPPEYLKVSFDAVERIKKDGYTAPYEKAYYRKDGSLVYMLMGAVRIKDSSRYDCMTYVIDVSERKRAEEELNLSRLELENRVQKRTQDITEANLFLNSLIENIPNMIFVKDAKNLKFVRFNQAGEKLIGITKQNMIGKSDYDFFPKSEAERFVEADRAVLRSKQILDIPEETLTTKSGPKVLHTKKIPLLDSKGNPIYLLGISEDITADKKIESEKLAFIREQAAREEAEKNVTRLELMAEANAVLNSSLDFNKTASDFFHFVKSKIADYCQLFIEEGPDDSPVCFESHPTDPTIGKYFETLEWKLIKDIDAANESSPSVVLDQLKSLKLRSVISIPLRVRGTTLGNLLVATTAQSNETFDFGDLHLVESLAERASLSLDNALLFSRAQKANRLKDEFLATLSHELRTPLNVIHGYSELLKNFSDNMTEQERSESIMAIYRNALDQATLINDILDVSKIITGKMSVTLTPMAPTDIVMAVVKNAVKTAEVKNIQIITQMPKVAPVIMMNSTRMHQVIWNLLSNAIKFTPANGRVLIKLSTEASDCIISVQDTGKGISTEFLPHIFEKFRQEDGSMTRKYGGLGLGLAIVRSLVEMHGGTVEVRSEGLDKGTEFFVKIPLVKNFKASDVKALDNGRDSKQLQNLKVLLVEDSKDNRLLVSTLLTNYGAEVQSAESAKMGHTLLQNYSPDIILCDIGMPDQDGVQFIQQLRSTNNQTPVIALTAYAREEEKRRFMDAGFQAHIAKPVVADVLLSEIKRLISSPS